MDQSKTLFRFAVVTAAALFLQACSNGGSVNSRFPAVANPPPFDYADGEELRSGMHELAFQLQLLDQALGMESDLRDPQAQDQIINSLETIERVGRQLSSVDMTSSHRFLRNDMEIFLSTVERAQRSAERNPPDYYMAGRVSGACINCHMIQR